MYSRLARLQKGLAESVAFHSILFPLCRGRALGFSAAPREAAAYPIHALVIRGRRRRRRAPSGGPLFEPRPCVPSLMWWDCSVSWLVNSRSARGSSLVARLCLRRSAMELLSLEFAALLALWLIECYVYVVRVRVNWGGDKSASYVDSVNFCVAYSI